MKIDAHALGEHFVYNGDAQMTQGQQDFYKQLIGDGLGRISLSRDEADKDFGNGGGIMVTVSLTCDQSSNVVAQTIGLAFQIADAAVKHYQPIIKADLVARGKIRP